MRNPRRSGVIIDTDEHLLHRQALPPGLGQDFDLELKPAGFDIEPKDFRQRVNPKPALGIGPLAPARGPHPEIGKPATEPAGPGHMPIDHALALPHHNGPRAFQCRRDESPGLFGAMLAVGIDGDRPVGELGSSFESGPQCGSLTGIDRMPQAMETRHPAHDVRRLIRGAIIDDHDRKAQFQCLPSDLLDVEGVIVYRYDDGEPFTGMRTASLRHHVRKLGIRYVTTILGQSVRRPIFPLRNGTRKCCVSYHRCR